MYCRSPEVSPLRHTSLRLRDQNTVRPSWRDWRSVSAFIHATISTSRVATSWTTAATRPASSYLMAASCSSVTSIGVAVGMTDEVRGLQVEAGTAFLEALGGHGVDVALPQ